MINSRNLTVKPDNWVVLDDTSKDITRRYPRTIQEACGAHASSHITEPERPYDWQDRAVLFACILTVAGLGIVWSLT